MHDIVDLESRGVVAGFIASAEFVQAAESQAKALAFEPARVFVSHPIQNRTDEEMRALADEALEDILGMVCEKR